MKININPDKVKLLKTKIMIKKLRQWKLKFKSEIKSIK